jgi:putative protease
MKQKIELLAPAGSFPALVAAVNAGADAVYLGLKDFNMRDSAKNFKLSDLPNINKICGRVKKYLTLNTIVYDNELAKIEKILEKVKGKVDAIICWDLSVISLCKKYKIPFHISTQASIANSAAAEFYKNLGAERVILARELNLKQIKKISKILPIECFVHGAMCVSISGRCFTSQFQNCESANRGKCKQPCRREYKVIDDMGNELKVKNSHIFSAKDLCALPFLEKLKKAGITAFKIEGRSRDPEYIDTVVRVYRKALDKKLTKEEIAESIKELEKVYNKSFSSGFYLKLPTNDDFSSFDHSRATEKKEFIGKILHYLPKIQVGILKLNSGNLKLGDEVFIIGNKTGLLRVRIESMQIHKKPIQIVNKGQLVGIKLPFCRENDEVYKIKKL